MKQNIKLFKILGVINLKQTIKWELVQGESKWVNAVLIDSEYPSIADHFAFTFNTKKAHEILNFSFKLLEGKKIW